MFVLMVGYSLGEYFVLVCVGVINFVDVVCLVEMCGKFMQEVVLEGIGGMFVIIGLDDVFIVKVCEEFVEGQVVLLVNFNLLGQVVIVGYKEVVECVGVVCKVVGVKCVLLLLVSVLLYCVLMKLVVDKLVVELVKIIFSMLMVLVVNNVDVKCEIDVVVICDVLVCQLYNLVQWMKSVEFIVVQGVEYFYEVGSGKVFIGLMKCIVDILIVLVLNELVVLFVVFM